CGYEFCHTCGDAELSGRTRRQHAVVLFGMKERLWILKSHLTILKSSPRWICFNWPDGTKKAYVKLTPDYEALEVANKIGII
ncbi:60S ribosomal protein L23a, partial [Tanacetum coccineum]